MCLFNVTSKQIFVISTHRYAFTILVIHVWIKSVICFTSEPSCKTAPPTDWLSGLSLPCHWLKLMSITVVLSGDKKASIRTLASVSTAAVLLSCIT